MKNRKLLIIFGVVAIILVIGLILGLVLIKKDNKKVVEQGSFKDGYMFIIYSTDVKEKTELVAYDRDFKEVGLKKYKFAGVLLNGFQNIMKNNNTFYVAPKGLQGENSYGKAVGINPFENTDDYYDFKRDNITDLVVDGDDIYTFSNMDGVVHIDKMNMETKKIDSIETRDYMIVNGITACNGKVYGLGPRVSEAEDEKDILLYFNFLEKKVEEVYSLPVDSIYLDSYENNLYMGEGNKLLIYDTNTNKMNVNDLEKDNARIINVSNGKLLIGYTDYYDGNDNSSIDIIDLKNNNKQSIDIKGFINQIEIDENNNLWVFMDNGDVDDSHLKEYDLETLKEVKDFKIPNKSDYSIGGFLVK